MGILPNVGDRPLYVLLRVEAERMGSDALHSKGQSTHVKSWLTLAKYNLEAENLTDEQCLTTGLNALRDQAMWYIRSWLIPDRMFAIQTTEGVGSSQLTIEAAASLYL